MGLRRGFVSFGEKGDVPEGLWKSVFFLTGFFGETLQASNSSPLRLSLPLSLGCRPSSLSHAARPRPEAGAHGRWLPGAGTGMVPSRARTAQAGHTTHPHGSASPCRGSSLAGTRPPPALLGQETCGAKVTWFKSPEPVADCCSALFGKGTCNLGQPRCPTPTGSVCPGQRVPPHPLPPAAQPPAEKSDQLHF